MAFFTQQDYFNNESTLLESIFTFECKRNKNPNSVALLYLQVEMQIPIIHLPQQRTEVWILDFRQAAASHSLFTWRNRTDDSRKIRVVIWMKRLNLRVG